MSKNVTIEESYSPEKIISVFTPINYVKDNLYICNSLAFHHLEIFSLLRIKHIISMRYIPQNISSYLKKEGVSIYSFWTSHDNFKEKWSKQITDILTILTDATSRGENIAVQCRSCMHRSATVIIGYLMKMEHITYKEALSFLQSKRLCVEEHYIIDENTFNIV